MIDYHGITIVDVFLLLVGHLLAERVVQIGHERLLVLVRRRVRVVLQVELTETIVRDLNSGQLLVVLAYRLHVLRVIWIPYL